MGRCAGTRVVARQRVVGVVGDDPLHAGDEQQRREALDRDLGRQCQQVVVVGQRVEEAGDERPAGLGVVARPAQCDLARLVADRGRCHVSPTGHGESPCRIDAVAKRLCA